MCLIASLTAGAADSPWSKTVKAQMEDAPPDVRAPVDGGRRVHPLPDGDFGKTSSAPFAFYGKVAVLWASAPPVRETLPEEILANTADHYVIGVTGLPATALSEIPSHVVATLAAKRNREVRADSAQVTSDRQMALFAFPRAKLPISKDPVTFRLRILEMTVQATFDPKEMRYKGKLAL